MSVPVSQHTLHTGLHLPSRASGDQQPPRFLVLSTAATYPSCRYPFLHSPHSLFRLFLSLLPVFASPPVMSSHPLSSAVNHCQYPFRHNPPTLFRIRLQLPSSTPAHVCARVCVRRGPHVEAHTCVHACMCVRAASAIIKYFCGRQKICSDAGGSSSWLKFSVASRPQRPWGLLGPRTATSTFTQLLSYEFKF